MTNNNNYGKCRSCNKLTYVSKRKLCANCSLSIQVEEQKQLKEKKGAFYVKWKEGVIRGVTGTKTGK